MKTSVKEMQLADILIDSKSAHAKTFKEPKFYFVYCVEIVRKNFPAAFGDLIAAFLLIIIVCPVDNYYYC